MDNNKNVGDNMYLGMDNSHLTNLIRRIPRIKTYFQTFFHSFTISQPFNPYPLDPTTNYVGVLVRSINVFI